MFKWRISFVKPLLDKFPHMATLYRSVRDQMDFMQEPRVTPWGFKLAGNAAMAQGTFEPAETELVREILKDVDVFVNIGANVGYYCCHALSMGKKVIAFEPIQRNLRYLYKNIKTNGWKDVEVYPIALSDNIGVLEIYGGNTGASVLKGWAGVPESYVALVPSSTLDLILGCRLQGKKVLIVGDVEGAEKWVLAGATQMLMNDPKPIWLLEITATSLQPHGIDINPNFMDTFKVFFQNGYTAARVDKGMPPVNMEHVEMIVRDCKEFPTHNFLFR